MMHDCDDEDCGFIEPRRFRALDLIGLAANTAGSIIAEVAMGFEGLANIVAAHTNWLDEQDDFAARARTEIEMLTGGEDD